MAKPLAKVNYFMEPSCDYPTSIRLAMDDGKVLTYILENKTDYQFKKVMDSLAKMKTGYQHKEEQERKYRLHRGKLHNR